MLSFLGISALLLLAGCMHVAGTVSDPMTKQGVQGAEITVGNPAGIGVFERHSTDARGRFDFYLFPTDENHLYLFDPQGDPSGARRIDRTEISDHMRLTLHRAAD